MNIESIIIGLLLGVLLSEWSHDLLAMYVRWQHRRQRRHVPIVRSFSILGIQTDLITYLVFGVDSMDSILGKTLALSIVNAKDADGAAVDLAAFPTALSEVVWSVSDTALGAVNTSQADGLKAEFVGAAEGDVTVTAVGKNAAGETVTQSIAVSVKPVPVPVVKSFEIEGVAA
jgi:hypothetical protein